MKKSIFFFLSTVFVFADNNTTLSTDTIYLFNWALLGNLLGFVHTFFIVFLTVLIARK